MAAGRSPRMPGTAHLRQPDRCSPAHRNQAPRCADGDTPCRLATCQHWAGSACIGQYFEPGPQRAAAAGRAWSASPSAASSAGPAAATAEHQRFLSRCVIRRSTRRSAQSRRSVRHVNRLSWASVAYLNCRYAVRRTKVIKIGSAGARPCLERLDVWSGAQFLVRQAGRHVARPFGACERPSGRGA